MALQFQLCSLHQVTMLLSHKVPFSSTLPRFNHPISPNTIIPPSHRFLSQPQPHLNLIACPLVSRLHPAALAFFHEKEKKQILEPHQYFSPDNKARRQWKGTSVSQLKQNNRAKCFLDITDPALWTACCAVFGPQEKDTLGRTCSCFG